MQTRNYHRLTNLCFWTAIAAALIFEGAGGLQWLVGLVGLVVGVSAVVLYVKNQADSAQKPSQTQLPETTVSATPETKSYFETISTQTVEHLAVTRAFLIGRSWQALDVYGHVWRRRRHFAEDVVHVVKMLSSEKEGPDYTFVLDRDGSFEIRPTRKAKSVSKERMMDLEDFTAFTWLRKTSVH